MNERQQILKMLESGKITAEEAEKLLNAVESTVESSAAVDQSTSIIRKKAHYLRVVVSADGADKVNVRVPLQLLRAGIKLGALIPQDVQSKVNASFAEKGMQFTLADINPETIEELIDGLSDLTVDINDNGEGVRVFCE